MLAESDIYYAGGWSLWRPFSFNSSYPTFFLIFDPEWPWKSLIITFLLIYRIIFCLVWVIFIIKVTEFYIWQNFYLIKSSESAAICTKFEIVLREQIFLKAQNYFSKLSISIKGVKMKLIIITKMTEVYWAIQFHAK